MLKFDQCELLAMVDVPRDLRVDFLKLAPSRDFETSSRAVKKLLGATLRVIEIPILRRAKTELGRSQLRLVR